MSRRGNCHDNAVAEGFFNLLKRERIRRRVYRSRDEARQDVFDYIEMFYNPTQACQKRNAVAGRVRAPAENVTRGCLRVRAAFFNASKFMAKELARVRNGAYTLCRSWIFGDGHIDRYDKYVGPLVCCRLVWWY